MQDFKTCKYRVREFTDFSKVSLLSRILTLYSFDLWSYVTPLNYASLGFRVIGLKH